MNLLFRLLVATVFAVAGMGAASAQTMQTLNIYTVKNLLLQKSGDYIKDVFFRLLYCKKHSLLPHLMEIDLLASSPQNSYNMIHIYA